MGLFAKVFKALGVVCLAAMILSHNVAFAIVSVIFTSVALLIEIKDFESK